MKPCDQDSDTAIEDDGALRPAAYVMSPGHAAVSVANALSFPRATMREMLRDRYRIEKLRFELDAQGRGEVLYRILAQDWIFHFFLIADLLPEDAKTDRNFAQGWDAMGVLCQGDWTPEREALLRREVPKQRAGYADYDTLMYARGNRSARVFDHVVESLAAGRQPDPKILAPVGYILRTTAFIGNGQLGTRPLAGYEPDHPLRRPYHAQFCSAFALREYVFDLADHLARARNPAAARLSPAMRRFIGLGNSAATGLTAFMSNHPHFMHQWGVAVEQAYAQVQAQPVGARDPVLDRCQALLDKTVRHYREGAKESDGVFSTPQTIAGELGLVRERLERYRTAPEPGAGMTWRTLCEELLENLGSEVREVLLSVLLELYPDIAVAQTDAFEADERFEVRAAMTAGELLVLLEQDYRWAIEQSCDASATRCFWYRCSSAPRDVRRALRGRMPQYEAETNMDTVLQAGRLHEYLRLVPGDRPVARVLCDRPDLRHIAARVQSLAGMDYAEMRHRCLAADFSPFESIRYVLTFYGMEKFDAAKPKSVRGTFMQGAPIAEDVERGLDADWPFPLMPEPSSGSGDSLRYLEPLPVSTVPDPGRHMAAPARATDLLRIAPGELARMVQTALQGHGLALGVAQEGGDLVAFAHACSGDAVQAQLDAFTKSLISPEVVRRIRLMHEAVLEQPWSLFDAGGAAGIACAAQAHDLALVQAWTSQARVGLVAVRSARQAGMVKKLVVRAASKGVIGLLLWQEPDADRKDAAGYAVAGPDGSAAWFACGRLDSGSAFFGKLMDGWAPEDFDDLAGGSAREQAAALAAGTIWTSEPPETGPERAPGYVLLYVMPRDESVSRALADAVRAREPAVFWRGADLIEQRQGWLRRGLTLTREQFDALNRAGNSLLVPQADEHRLLPEGADPLKTF